MMVRVPGGQHAIEGALLVLGKSQSKRPCAAASLASLDTALRKGMEYLELGSTGLHVSRLSIGTGTHGFGGRSDQTALGVEKLADLLRQGYEREINFWDAADGYGSHPHLARALRSVPRDKVVIATKTMSRTGPGVREDIDRFLRELGTDVIDIVLLHFVTRRGWSHDYRDAMDELSQAKEAGRVRAVGISCHDLGALREASQSQWLDVALVRINPTGTNMDAAPERVVPVIQHLYESGKGVYAMKVLGCGRLAGRARESIQYVLGLGTVHAMTIGMTSSAQLLQNVRIVNELAPAHPLQPRAEVARKLSDTDK
jgi:aryl-alcohol dehydrogenase-like predicted oxidoreductase